MAETSATFGRRQSPIDLSTTNCVSKSCGVDAAPVQVQYPPALPGLPIQNTGHGWKVDIPDNLAADTLLTGGPLEHSYRLAQFHCHWGKTCDVGSEHTVDGKSYAAELHFVHWNTDLYASVGDAMPGDNGLAVLGVFLEVGVEENVELNKLLAHISDILYKGDQTTIAQDVDIEKLLPENRSYYSYLGSLTTPPYWESVSWIVFANPIQCTEEQIAKFRQLCHCCQADDTVDRNLVENFRLPQPIFERTLTLVRN